MVWALRSWLKNCFMVADVVEEKCFVQQGQKVPNVTLLCSSALPQYNCSPPENSSPCLALILPVICNLDQSSEEIQAQLDIQLKVAH